MFLEKIDAASLVASKDFGLVDSKKEQQM